MLLRSRRLSTQLYADSTHFVFELLQNADDVEYDETVIPTIKFQLLPPHSTTAARLLIVSCNEKKGFSAGDVESICGVANSSKIKKKGDGYIGEKGIGFKSVFRVAERVSISSGFYNFTLDRSKELGMISPEWSPQMPISLDPKWQTTFFLQIPLPKDIMEVENKLLKLDAPPLLFLRRLERIEIIIPSTATRQLSKNFRKHGDMELITLTSPDEKKTYILSKEPILKMPIEKAREGVTSSEVVLAFETTENGLSNEKNQLVFSFLPFAHFGFRVSAS